MFNINVMFRWLAARYIYAGWRQVVEEIEASSGGDRNGGRFRIACRIPGGFGIFARVMERGALRKRIRFGRFYFYIEPEAIIKIRSYIF